MNVLFHCVNGIRNKRLLFNTMAQRFVCVDRAKFSNNPVRIGAVDVTPVFYIGHIQGKISVFAVYTPLFLLGFFSLRMNVVVHNNRVRKSHKNQRNHENFSPRLNVISLWIFRNT